MTDAVPYGWARQLKRLRSVGAGRRTPSTAYAALGGKLSRGHVLLDIGCGDSNDRMIAHSRGVIAYGVDLHPPLRRTTERFVRADARRLPFADSSVNAAICKGRILMSEALAVIEKTDPITSSVHLVARNPVEMQNAQADLAVWLKDKIVECEIDVQDYEAALTTAKQNGWATSSLNRAKNKAVGERTFYSKLLTAVEAGFTIVPEFPIDVFAVRVQRQRPNVKAQSSTYSTPRVADEAPDILQAGVGRYVSPSQTVQNREFKETKDGKEITRYWQKPVGLRDVVFPVRSARVEVMNATASAMALKVFDQIGICPQTRRGSDPLIIGQILGQKQGYTQKTVSFIIAWHLDLRTL